MDLMPARRMTSIGLGLLCAITLAAVAPRLLQTQGLMPHGFCITWQPDLIALHALSDIMIGLAYLSIPVTLFYFSRRRTDLPFRGVFLLFALFIVSCGLTHFIEVVTLWQPYYWLSGVVKAITAFASIATAIVLITLIPAALALPSPAQLKLAYAKLEIEVEQRRKAEDDLRKAGAELEHRVAQRTRELEAARREVEQAKLLLDTFFEQTPLGLGVWDEQLRYVRVNERLAEINGIPARAHVGRQIEELLPDVGPSVAPVMRRVWASGTAVTDIEATGKTPGSDGRLRTWRVTFFPIQSGGEIRALGATCEDVTVTKHLEAERDRLLDAERAARADAERANGLKDQFLAVVSHELRNPLNAIVGWTQLATQGSLPQDKLADALKRIERNAMAQARLIDDLLDVSRIMTGNLSLVNQPTGLRGPIGATVEALRPEALRKHIALDVDLGSDDIIVDGDSDRLQQVAMNLIGNALKFTPEGGHVEVALRIADGEAQFIVSDTGPGIDPAFLPELFQPFRRADASASRRHQGLGLGLAIARNLVELHGGRIDVANRPDGGAVFRVALPLAEAPAVDATLQPRDAAGDLAGMEVLLVEDNRDTLDMLQQALEGVGAVVEAHDNAVDGLAAAQRRHFDVLVTDIGMPDHDGFWLLEQVRGRQPTIKALAVTAFASAEDRARSLAAGFQRHLAKPMHTEQLIAALRGLVSRPS